MAETPAMCLMVVMAVVSVAVETKSIVAALVMALLGSALVVVVRKARGEA